MPADLSRRRLLATAGAAVVAGTLLAPRAAGAAQREVGVFATTIGPDPADVYHPVTPSPPRPWPVVLVLQGANVDKGQYAELARQVAGYGFVVVVPNHFRVLYGQPGLFVVGAQAQWTVDWAVAEQGRAGSPVAGALDVATLLLFGHSFGGAAGLGLTTGLSTPPFSDVPTPAPAQLRAAAFFGTNNVGPGGPAVPPVANLVPVALIQGSTDGIASPANGLATFQALQAPPKLYVDLQGANHYGVTDVQNPPGARPETAPQTLDQAVSVATCARWGALWLRAQLGDPAARAWVYGLGDVVDRNVTTQVVR
ncbi:alpha/beta hydrolase family protein [Actinoplanes sp. NPDC049668]|uniref:alpha/beta hydrolase family protein n=1 Tax=unclassified Actinoplanes TaxID=2626549 RepID=UPI00339EA6EB